MCLPQLAANDCFMGVPWDPLNVLCPCLHTCFPIPPLHCSYEGLTRDAIAHGMGVMLFGNGTGGGFHLRDVKRGDK